MFTTSGFGAAASRGNDLPRREYTACRTQCSTFLPISGISQQLSCKIFQNLSDYFQMTAEERKHRIEEYLQKVEFSSLEELSKHVGASVSTVRRDLTVLESGGNLKRTHGGARIVNPKTDEFIFSARDTHQLSEKES